MEKTILNFHFDYLTTPLTLSLFDDNLNFALYNLSFCASRNPLPGKICPHSAVAGWARGLFRNGFMICYVRAL